MASTETNFSKLKRIKSALQDWPINPSLSTEREYAKEIGFYQAWQIYTRLKNRNDNVIIQYSYRPICNSNFPLFPKHALMYLTSIRSITAPPTLLSFFFFFLAWSYTQNSMIKFHCLQFFSGRFHYLFYFLIITENIFFLSYRWVLKKIIHAKCQMYSIGY